MRRADARVIHSDRCRHVHGAATRDGGFVPSRQRRAVHEGLHYLTVVALRRIVPQHAAVGSDDRAAVARPRSEY